MKYNFDEVVDRRGTDCLKYDFGVEKGKKDGLLPLWVADMDFRVAPEITKRLQKGIDHAIYGYTETKDDYFTAVRDWCKKRFSWDIKKDWLVKTPGIVFALAMGVKAYTNEGEGVIVQHPGYHPFVEAIENNNRKVVVSNLILKDGKYRMDFEDFENKIKTENVKFFILCNPHNPVGRVWTKEELLKIGEICLKYNVIVASDEIHADFIFKGNKHHVFADIDERFKNISLVCMAPSKTFNIAGLQVSNIFIPDKDLRNKFRKAIAGTGYSQLNTLGLTAAKAAYEEGEEWLEELLVYIQENVEFVKAYIKEKLPKLRVTESEGTYLLWVDFSGLGISDKERADLLENKAGLWLHAGTNFGAVGTGFERINLACPRATLREALDRLRKACEEEKLL